MLRGIVSYKSIAFVASCLMSPPNASSPTLLCVDDEAEILALLRDTFGLAAYHVFTARSGKRALNILRQTAIDVVLLDYTMRVKDRLALAIEIKHANPEMPLVVFSATPEEIPHRLRHLAYRIADLRLHRPRTDAVQQAVASQRRPVHALRAYPRFNVDMRVLLISKEAVESGVFWISARTLGEGGIGADLPVPLQQGATVLLDLVLRDQVLTLPSSVRYQTGAFHGFQFLDISNEQRAAIRKYCEAC